MLNEKNIQACFQYNASTGNWVFEKVDGSLLVDLESPRVRSQVGSDKIAIDLGYSVDGKVNDWKFTIDGIGMLAIKTVAMRNDLIRLPIEKNECAIVTNDPNFRTILWLNSENDMKKLNYSFTTLNSSISCWVGDEIAKKLNAYDPTALDTRITETESRITNAEERLNTTETNITDLQTGFSEEITARETADTAEANTRENEDNALNTRLITLEENTKGFTRNTSEGKTFFTDSIVSSGSLAVSESGTFGDGISVINGDSTFENTSVKDLTVRGVVNGELKDKDGFKWTKFKSGIFTGITSMINIEIELYNTGRCLIKGSYNDTTGVSVNADEVFIKNINLPFSVKKINNVIVSETDTNMYFLVVSPAIGDGTSSFNTINLYYKNITSYQQRTSNYNARLIIECEVNIDDVKTNSHIT